MHRDHRRLLHDAEQNNVIFQDVISTIRAHYECTPVAFSTGAGTALHTDNAAGANAASSQLLAYARRLGLDAATALRLYGEHYRDVQADPSGTSHANIRAFMANGWAGVVMPEDPLRLRGPA
ncbi:MAG: HopJ type III effector protein [Gammaproteobacteria bacterium]